MIGRSRVFEAAVRGASRQMEGSPFEVNLPHQFDLVLHYDRMRAVEPLERTTSWERGELPETYPNTV